MLNAKINVGDQSLATDDRRFGADRITIDKPSTVRADDLSPRDVVVEDLSSSGFRFRSDDGLRVGSTIFVGLAGGGMAQARVVRVNDDQHGCEFERPLTGAQLQSAFNSPTVLAVSFPVRYGSTVIAEREEKWPGAVRLSILLGGTALCWAALVQIGATLIR